MTSFPSKMVLHYALASAFLEQEALAGRFMEREQQVEYDLGTMAPEDADRLKEVWSQLSWVGRRQWPIVHGTGIDDSSVGDGPDDFEAMDAPVRAQIGGLPTLAGPPASPADLIGAYERWIDDYRKLSLPALMDWASKFAMDEELTDAYYAHGVEESFWRIPVRVRSTIDSRETTVRLDARAMDPVQFQRARAALVRRHATRRVVGKVSWSRARDIVESTVWIAVPLSDIDEYPVSRIVDGYEAVSERLAAVALAHHHLAATEDRHFTDDMNAWAAFSGSDRLQLGLEGGYRMTAVYLDERRDIEAPTFYAFRPEQPEVPIGRERTGPSGKALRLCRAVQAHLDEVAVLPSGSGPLVATIRWVGMDDLPKQLVKRSNVDDGGLEAIVVPGWLGRYQLIGLVRPERTAPPWAARFVDPAKYGLPSDAPSDSAIAF